MLYQNLCCIKIYAISKSMLNQNLYYIKIYVGVGGTVQILGDIVKSWALPFFFQDSGVIKPNPKLKRILCIFGGLHP